MDVVGFIVDGLVYAWMASTVSIVICALWPKTGVDYLDRAVVVWFALVALIIVASSVLRFVRMEE